MLEPIIEIPITRQEYDGKVEHTELTDIDRAVGSFFQSVLHSLVVVDTGRQENQEFARFAERDKSTKLYMGEFANPQEFLTKLTAKTGTKATGKRNALLPVAYISRDPVISFVEGGEYIDITGHSELFSKGGSLPYARVNKSFVRLTYVVTTLAWSKATLSRLALGVIMWARHQKQGRKHVFQAKSMLAGAEVMINVELTGMKDSMAEPAEVDHENTRLYASTIQFEVVSEIFEAESMTVTRGTVGVFEGGQIE